MQIQVKATDLHNKTGIRPGDIMYVKKTKQIGDKTYFGLKSPNRGIVWYAQNEVVEV